LFRQILGVFAERSQSLVALVGDPENVVSIQNSPNGRERIPESKVDAADLPTLIPRLIFSEALPKSWIDQTF
jgi:hypothetical protein